MNVLAMPKTWAMEWRGTLGRLFGNNVVSSIVACTLASLSILNICSKVRNVSSFHDFYLCSTLLPRQFNRFSDFSHAHSRFAVTLTGSLFVFCLNGIGEFEEPRRTPMF